MWNWPETAQDRSFLCGCLRERGRKGRLAVEWKEIQIRKYMEIGGLKPEQREI